MVMSPDQMGTLGKIGFVLSSFANPNLPMQYQQALEDKRLNDLNAQNVQSQIEARRIALQQQRKQMQREQEARRALGSVLSRGMMPDVQGAPNPQALGTITPQQMGELYMHGVDLGELGTIQQMLNPEQDLIEVYDPNTGMMIRVPESQAVGMPSQAPTAGKDRRIVEQDGVQYYADTGEPVIKAPIRSGKGKDFKEFELTAAAFGNRMVGAENTIKQFENMEGFNPVNVRAAALGSVSDAAENIALNPEQRQYKQAARDWIQAKLRKESGAAIPPEEIESEYRTFFPVVGDDQKVIEQKRIARERATKSMLKQSGGAYEDMFGSPMQETRVIDFNELPE